MGDASRRTVFRARKFRVEHAAGPGGTEAAYVRHPGAAVILPLLDDGRVVLVRNRRPAVGAVLLELPAGTLEAGESPRACAERELAEETGYRAERWRALVSFYSTPGFCDERMHVFVAEGLLEGAARPEADEDLTVERVPMESLLGMVDGGEVVDAKSLVALMMYARQRDRETEAG